MKSLATLSAIKNWQNEIDQIADLIGTKLRNRRLLTKSELMASLDNKNQSSIIEWVYKVNPVDFGSNLPFYGLSEPPGPEQFHILNRYLRSLKDEPVLDIQYVPKQIYESFTAMRNALKDELGTELVISSAYRSPAFQALVVCYNLRRHNYDVQYTLKYTAPPGYSDHGLYPNVALDLQFGGEEYVRPDRIEGFAATKEFKWLKQNAQKFGFYLPYPKNNGAGLLFEPWHWRFKS